MKFSRLVALAAILGTALLAGTGQVFASQNESLQAIQQNIRAAQQKLDQAEKAQGKERDQLMQEHMKMME